MKLIGLISPNLSEGTLEDVYKVFPAGIRIEGRTLKVGKYTDDEFHRAELAFADLVRDLARQPLDFLIVTGELFLSFKGPGSDLEILDLVKQITAIPASTVLTAVVRGCRAEPKLVPGIERRQRKRQGKLAQGAPAVHRHNRCPGTLRRFDLLAAGGLDR